MEEIEVKFLNIDKAAIIQKLESLGAKKVLDCEVDTELFEFSDRRLSAEGKTLRLRTLGDDCALTLKKGLKREGAKVMEAHETSVSNHAEMREILTMLGLKATKRWPKHRISYSFEGAHFELDTLEGIPTYLEIEGKSVPELKRLAGLLGLSMADSKPWSSRDVIKHYSRKRFSRNIAKIK